MPLAADDFAELYDRHARTLVLFFQRRTYDPEAAVDLMAETFAAAFRDRDGGLFYEGGLRRADCRPPRVPPTRTLPVVSGMGFSSGHPGEDDLFLGRARIERRLQRGRLEIGAICHPDVERVTIQTPRDVRTLVPSPRARAILAVYAGNFRAGEIVITAHLRGGRTWSERYPLGF